MRQKKITISISLAIIILYIGVGSYQFNPQIDKLHDFYTARDAFVCTYQEFKDDLKKLEQGKESAYLISITHFPRWGRKNPISLGLLSAVPCLLYQEGCGCRLICWISDSI